MTGPRNIERFGFVRRWLLFLLPWVVALATVLLQPSGPATDAPKGAETAATGKVVVLILDSLRPQSVESPTLMPFLHGLAESSPSFDVHTCSANFTLPCVQTLLEGRESPFVAGLHNFTGQAGSASSLPATATQAGLGVVLMSDHTLPSLYGEHALRSYDVQTWPGDHLEHDLHAIEVAAEELQKNDTDLLILHLIGTDKAAHHQRPGTDPYRAHFGAVDAALKTLFESIDPTRDRVIITGDHGHGPKGHHNHESVVIFYGDQLTQLLGRVDLPELQQTDLLYFMSYALLLPVPVGGDTRFFDYQSDASDPRSQKFLDLHAHLDSGESISKAFDATRQKKRSSRHHAALGYLPLLVLGACIAAWMLARARRSLSSKDFGFLATAGITAVALGYFANPATGPILAIVVAVERSLWAVRNEAWRETLTALVIVAMACFTGAFAEEWSSFFHTRGGFQPTSLIFYGSLILFGFLFAKLLWNDVKLAPEASMLFCLGALPSGVYYYHFGQNFYLGFVLTAAALVLASLAQKKGRAALVAALPDTRSRLTAGLLVVTCIYPLLQESGGWEWNFLLLPRIEALGSGVWAMYLAVGLVCLGLLRSSKHRIALGLMWVLFPLYAVVFAELPSARWVAATVMTVATITYYSLRGSRREEALALFLLAACLHIGWLQLDGFFLNHTDFQFGLRVFGGLQTEAQTFALTQIATNLKYSLAYGLLVGAARLVLGRERFGHVITYVIAFGFLKIIALFGHILFGRGFQSGKLFEIGISDLIFVTMMTLMIPFFAAGISAIDMMLKKKTEGDRPTV